CARPRAFALTMLVACFTYGFRGCIVEDVTLNGDTTPVRVEFDVKAVDGHTYVEYWATNQTSAPILLLDRRRNWKVAEDKEHPLGFLNPEWVDVEIIESFLASKVVLSRWQHNNGICATGAAVPYGRRLDPGQTASGKFEVPIPLPLGKDRP